MRGEGRGQTQRSECQLVMLKRSETKESSRRDQPLLLFGFFSIETNVNGFRFSGPFSNTRDKRVSQSDTNTTRPNDSTYVLSNHENMNAQKIERHHRNVLR